MLRNRDDISRACLLKESRPIRWVPFLGFELRNEIFVSEYFLRTVPVFMFLKCRIFLLIHVARVPLVLRAGN